MECINLKEVGIYPIKKGITIITVICLTLGLVSGQTRASSEGMDFSESVNTREGKVSDASVLMDSNLKNIDAVEIVFPADSTSFVTGVYPLDEEKCMQLPAYGLMCLKGKSTNEIKDELESAYSGYLRYPFVKVEFLMRIGLLGGFYSPGLYYVRSVTSLWDVIAMGGGPEREDGFQKMKWVRNEDVLKENLTEEIISGKTLSELNFKSGDVIAVLDRPKIGLWGTLRTEVFPFLLLLASMATAYVAVYSIVER